MLHDLSRQLRHLLNEATRPSAGHRHSSLAGSERNVIRLRNPATQAAQRSSENWQQRLLTKLGARMHATSVERGDGCSIAILDANAMVVAWHDTLPGATLFDSRVVGSHVAQFYLARDVAFQRPARGLSAASLHGSATEQGWHRRPGGAIFWGVTVIEAMRLQTGELHGYSHVTRYSQEPRQSVLAEARRPPRDYSACHGGMAVA